MGDKYANKGYSSSGDPTVGVRNLGGQEGLKPKDLIGLPWRVAFALQADGWWIRQENIWHKPNPMPESVVDRTTRAHESIFMLTKSPRYFYDGEAIKEPSKEMNWESRFDRIKADHKSFPDAMKNGVRTKICRPNSRFNIDRDFDHTKKGNPQMKRRDADFDSRYMPSGKRNLRSVWCMATHPYPDAHFATFPPRLPEICIRAGTSQHGACAQCGAPWVRVVERSRKFMSGSGKSGNLPLGKNGTCLQGGGETLDIRRGPVIVLNTLGWKPSCQCECTETVPCLVLDPFAGAGTTLMVALRLGRRAIGIELNPEYVKLANNRIVNDAPLLNAI